GRLLGKHRKLQPVAAEKLLWGQGDGSTLTVIDTPLGRIGGLLCWENYMPLARAALYGKGLDIYLAPTVDDRDTWQPSMRHIAMEGRCFVIAPCQYWTKSMVPEGFDVFDELAAMPEVLCRGGSVVVSPLGEVLAGPLYGEEGMLTVTLDLADVTRGRYDMDTINEYGRPDVFELRVNETEQKVVKYDGQ
ncbi:MAG: nitrilase, partial [Planctomycetes bacterium]|nr:nitrilase [Planctomycetota bacterium]